MIVGIPGAGIGGLFYLLSALWMPFHTLLARRGSGRPPDRRLVLRQVFIGIGIAAGIWVTGWLLGIALVPDPAASVRTTAGTLNAHEVRNIWRVGMLVAAVFTLGVVLLSVQIMTLLFCRRVPTVVRESRSRLDAANRPTHLGLHEHLRARSAVEP